MKKMTFTVVVAAFLLITNPMESKAQELTVNENTPETISAPIYQNKKELKEALLLRLDELKAIDKSELSSTEKKELRKEVKDIKKTASNNGIYLSTGAIIIILLIIIIL